MNEFISKAFEELERSGVDYCILRNYGELPHTLPKGDVDILIEYRYGIFNYVERIVARIARSCGWSLHARLRHSVVSLNLYYSKIVYGKVQTINLEFSSVVAVYIKTKYREVGYCYLHTSDVIATRKSHNGLHVISDEYEFVHLLCELLFNEKEKYEERLISLFSRIPNSKNLKEVVAAVFGDVVGEELVGAVGEKKFDTLKSNLKKIYESFERLNRSSRYWYFFRDLMSVKEHFVQYLFPAGKLCVILGPDGSGKTFLADRFAAKHNRAFSKIRRIHLGNRPIILNSLRGRGDTLGERNQVDANQEGKFHDGKMPESYSRSYNTARFIYHYMDYVLHYWFFLRVKISNGELVLSERYIYDYVVSPDRYICGVPLWIKSLLSGLTPQPDILINLVVDPIVLLDRKRELPLELLEKEQAGYRNIKKGKVRVNVDNKGEPQMAISQIEKVVFDLK